MIAFPTMLVKPAKRVGMKVPADQEAYNPDEFPHWFIFTKMQLGASMPRPGCHWDNAQVVADVPEADIRSVTPQMLVDMGFEVGFTIP